LQACVKGANEITQATPTYFLTVFVIAFGEIFLEYSWNILEKSLKKCFILKKNLHTISLKFMLKIWENMSLSKKLKFIYKFFLCLKSSVIMFNE
jgi:glucose-6-phosphate-specific signal transduction histidine kinase